MKAVSTGLGGSIENGTGRAAILSREVGGLDVEFGDGIEWRKNGVVGAVQEVDGIRVVVDTIQQIVILRGTQAVGGEGAGCGVAARIGLCGLHTGCQLGKEGKVASIQREIVDGLFLNDLADRGLLSLKHGRCRCDLNRLRGSSGFQADADRQMLRDVEHQIGLGGFGEAGCGNADRVMPNSDRRKGIFALAVGVSLEREPHVRV